MYAKSSITKNIESALHYAITYLEDGVMQGRWAYAEVRNQIEEFRAQLAAMLNNNLDVSLKSRDE